VEVGPVPRGDAGLGVVVVDRRVIPSAVNLIGVADLIEPARGRLLIDVFGGLTE